MILDKLLEKKDLSAYIKWRIEQLRKELVPKEIKKLPEKQRFTVQCRISGRIKELRQLKRVLVNQGIKEESIRISTKILREARLKTELKVV